VPELPDVTVYVEALKTHVRGRRLDRIHLHSAFVLRSVEPPLEAAQGQTLVEVGRVGKRIVLEFPDAVFLVIHLMVAGRLRWRVQPTDPPRVSSKLLLATLRFENGSLLFTEAGSKKRASMQMVKGQDALRALDPGGLEPLDATPEQFHDALTRENHTLKRALTDPHLFSGIGNAFSDEILHAARLSPLKLTRSLTDAEFARLFDATRATLQAWIRRLREQAAGRFPETVTAFREGMAVHGRFRQPCPACGTQVQRIVYAENECNYCPRCQTGGRLLADRSLSRLLKADWPKRIE
jgi:formamidopyrimidine-DNA glycosylase